jgi:NAD(P)H-dependent FMN reductase
MTLRVLGVAGSMRSGAFSTRVLNLCMDMAARHGAQIRLLDLNTLDLPMFRPDSRDPSESARETAEAVQWADAFLLATPDYHGSMSGAIKNFLDYHWEAFAGKLFGYICASHEKGLTAMDQMRTAVRQCYGWSLPYGLSVHGKEEFPADGQGANPRFMKRASMLSRDLVVYGAMLRQQFNDDLQSGAEETFAAQYKSH